MASAKPRHIRIDEVRTFWEAHPVAAAVPFPLGSREYFTYYDRLREANEKVPARLLAGHVQ